MGREEDARDVSLSVKLNSENGGIRGSGISPSPRARI